MITVARELLWLGGCRTGKTVRVWADTDVIHLLVDGARVKSIRSHLSVNDIALLIAQDAVSARRSRSQPSRESASRKAQMLTTLTEAHEGASAVTTLLARDEPEDDEIPAPEPASPL